MKATSRNSVRSIVIVVIAAFAVGSLVWGARLNHQARKERAYNKFVLEYAKQGVWIPAWSLFDHISLYQREGFVEHYGMNFRESRIKPIKIEHTILEVTEDRSWLVWSPDQCPISADCSLIEVAFPPGAFPCRGQFTVGFVFPTGKALRFEYDCEKGTKVPWKNQPPYVPAEFLKTQALSTNKLSFVRSGNCLLGMIPETFRKHIIDHGFKAVQSWYIEIAGAKNTVVPFAHISMLRPHRKTEPIHTVQLSGSVNDYCKQGPVGIELLLETGEKKHQELQPDGTFTFENVPAAIPVAIYVEHYKRRCYTTLGHWFIPQISLTGLVIDLAPHFQYHKDIYPDLKRAAGQGDQSQDVLQLYAKHSRQVYVGNERYPSEWEGISFSNNFGFLDRDRFFDNPDNCFRIVHLGSSLAVGCHVRPGEKYNMIMESALGLRLQRPVEVISLGRNNGDIAVNFAYVRDLAVKFNPDLILMENGSSLMMQLHPDLLHRMHGFDPSHSPLDNFVYTSPGNLAFRPWSRDWAGYCTKPNITELTPGIPFGQTLRYPHLLRYPRLYTWCRLAPFSNWCNRCCA